MDVKTILSTVGTNSHTSKLVFLFSVSGRIISFELKYEQVQHD